MGFIYNGDPWTGCTFRFGVSPLCCYRCQACKDYEYPQSLTVTLGNFQDGGAGQCNNCQNANGSWTIRKASGCAISVNPRTDADVPVDGLGPPPSFIPQSMVTYYGEFPGVPMCWSGLGFGYLTISLSIFWNQFNWNAKPSWGTAAASLFVSDTASGCRVGFGRADYGQVAPYDCGGLALALEYTPGSGFCNPLPLGQFTPTCQVGV